MRIHFRYQAAALIAAVLFSGGVSAAMYTKTVTPPAASTVMSSGTPNLAANILEVGMAGVEYIPSAASESRAVANITKGISIPTSGIVSSLKTGLRANLGSLAVGAVVSGIIAGVDWAVKDGALVKSGSGEISPYTPTGTDYYWDMGGSKSSSPSALCDAQLSQFVSNYPGYTFSSSLRSESPTSIYCSVTSNSWPGGGGYITRYGSTCPSGTTYSDTKYGCVVPGYAPLSDSDWDVLDGFVQGKDGVWQRGLADEVCKSASDYNACIANMGSQPYVTGPVSVSSPDVTTTTTTQNSDGTSTEVSTKTHTDYQLGYPSSSPGTIAIDPKTTTTTTTTTKDANGNVTGTNTTTGTQTTTQPGEGTSVADGTFTDTPFPDPGPFYTQKYPDGFKGVWDKNKSAFMDSDFIHFLNGFIPSFSGSCPTFGLSFDIMAYAHFGYVSFWSMCWIFDIIKTIMLVTAVFTCRALIFGG